MKKILLFLLALTVMLSACVSVGPTSCVEDNICSIDEKFRGGCNDCKPDFSIDDDNLEIYFDSYNNNVELYGCIENNGGEFTDRVNVQLELFTRDQYLQDEADVWVYFNQDEASGDLDVDVREGEIRVNGFFSILQEENEQQSCFSHTFTNVDENTYYFANVYLDSDNQIAERDENNNIGSVYLEGSVVSYAQYLIESDIAEYIFSASYMDSEMSDGFEFDLYQASYRTNVDTNGGNYAGFAIVVPTFYKGSASELLATLVDSQEELVYDSGLGVYSYSNRYFTQYVWVSNGVLVFLESTESDSLFMKYLARYPSTSEVQEAEAFILLDTTDVQTYTYDGVELTFENARFWRGNMDSVEINGVYYDTDDLEDGVTVDGVLIYYAEYAFTSASGQKGEMLIIGGYYLPNEATTYMELNKPVSFFVDDMGYQFEIIGGNDEGDNGNGNIILSVNGQQVVLEEGNLLRVDGFDELFYVQDLFVTNIPTLSASANIVTLNINVPQDWIVEITDSTYSTFLQLAQSQTVTVDGRNFEVEIIGANDVDQSIKVMVDGVVATLREGDFELVNDLEINVLDVFVTNIPTLSASANVEFPGSGVSPVEPLLYLQLSDSETITVDGKSFVVEIVGGNDKANNGRGEFFITVDGMRATLAEGDSESVNGLNVEVFDLFVTNIPTSSVSANLKFTLGKALPPLNTTFFELGEEQPLNVEGTSFNVEIIGGNDQANTILVSVNGIKGTLVENENVAINGLLMKAIDIFTANIPRLSASANIEIIGTTPVVVPAGEYFELNVSKAVAYNGGSYNVTIIAGNDQADNGNGNIIISVNGVRETLEEGDYERVNMLDIYVEDLFVTNIPRLSASANLVFVSEDEMLTAAVVNNPPIFFGLDKTLYASEQDGDQVFEIDLSKYAFDADGDGLTYSFGEWSPNSGTTCSFGESATGAGSCYLWSGCIDWEITVSDGMDSTTQVLYVCPSSMVN